MQPKDYDSTLARIAGNIAAGIVGRANGPDQRMEEGKREIAAIAFVLVTDILKLCRERAALDRSQEAK